MATMDIIVEEKPCIVMLDSCSSCNLVDEDFLINYLGVDKSRISGPSVGIKGIGNMRSYNKGTVELFSNVS